MGGIVSRGEGDPSRNEYITYLDLGPEAAKSRNMLKPLLSVLLGSANRPGINGMAIVLVQGPRDGVHIYLFERPTPFADKFDLWRIGAFRVGHLGFDENNRGVVFTLRTEERQGKAGLHIFIPLFLYVHTHIQNR